MSEQSCGDCKHFSQLRYTGRDAWGDCDITIPACLSGPKQMVRVNHGDDCPCWQAKDDDCDPTDIDEEDGE